MSKDFFYKDTGEKVMSNKHVRLMLDDIKALFGLTKIQRNVLDLMLRDCKYKNEILIPPRKKKEYEIELGLKPKRPGNTVAHAIGALKRAGVVKQKDKEAYPYLYMINPKLFFKGNEIQQAMMMIKYEGGERDIWIEVRP